MTYSPLRLFVAEMLATALLLAVVVGAGITATSLAQGNIGLAFLCQALATAAGLYILIEVFGPISGAHMNPAVTLIMVWRGALARHLLGPYVLAQMAGAVIGVWATHAMFDLPIWQIAENTRGGWGRVFSEVLSTFCLILLILRLSQSNARAISVGVGLLVLAGYWFAASAMFANPAVTFGRAFTNSFSGIAPLTVVIWWGAQIVGAALAHIFDRWLERK